MANDLGVRTLREHHELTRTTGEFRDPALEAQFWESEERELVRRGVATSVVAIALFQVLAVADLALNGVGPLFWRVLVARLVASMPAFAFLAILRNKPDLLRRHDLVAGLQAMVLLSYIPAALIPPSIGPVQHLSIGLVGMALFVLVPNRLRYVTPAVLGAFGLWVTAAAIVHDTARSQIVGQVLVFTACTGVGFVTASVVGRAQREAFQLLMAEREVNDRLSAEIDRRKQIELQLLDRANTDPLTGVASRRHFLERADLEFARARRTREPVAMLVLDLDRFKPVNDTHGHPAGDEVLRAVGEAFLHHLRAIDLIGRLGGEEFSVVMPGVDAVLAVEAAERLRRGVNRIRLEFPTGVVVPTVSIGVIECDVWTETVLDAMERADAAMYEAKEMGRDQVIAG